MAKFFRIDVSILHKCDYNQMLYVANMQNCMFQFYISAIITLYKTSLGLIVYQDDNDCKDNTFLWVLMSIDSNKKMMGNRHLV